MGAPHLTGEDRDTYDWYEARGARYELSDLGAEFPDLPPIWMRPLLSVYGLPVVETGIWAVAFAASAEARNGAAPPWSDYQRELRKQGGGQEDPGWTAGIISDHVRLVRLFMVGKGRPSDAPQSLEEAEILGPFWFSPMTRLTQYRLCVENCPEKGMDIGGIAAGKAWAAQRPATQVPSVNREAERTITNGIYGI